MKQLDHRDRLLLERRTIRQRTSTAAVTAATRRGLRVA
jgi:hypothetical protein